MSMYEPSDKNLLWQARWVVPIAPELMRVGSSPALMIGSPSAAPRIARMAAISSCAPMGAFVGTTNAGCAGRPSGDNDPRGNPVGRHPTVVGYPRLHRRHPAAGI